MLFCSKSFWNVESDFILTSIPPQKLHYPEAYTGEPAQIWKLTTKGDVELFFEFVPLARFSGWIDISPNFHYLSYSSESCIDGMGRISILDLETKEGFLYECMWEVPNWSKKDEHFIYELNGFWQIRDIYDKNNNQPIEFLNLLNESDVDTSDQWVWIDDEYFLLKLQNDKGCILNIATLQGIVKEIIRTDINNYCLANDVDINFSQ